MKRILGMMAAVLMVLVAAAQAKVETATIKTTIQCSMCEKRIMKNIPFEKGVKDLKVNVDNKTVWVQFDASKISVDKIRAAIAKLGYDADEVKRDTKAYDKLPACCKEDSGMGKH